jgi:hypothetical protein
VGRATRGAVFPLGGGEGFFFKEIWAQDKMYILVGILLG